MSQLGGGGGGGGGGGSEAGGEAGGGGGGAKAKVARILYMILTAYARDGKEILITTVVHVDVSSRLQTVSKTAEPFYNSLIFAFILGEPISEYP